MGATQNGVDARTHAAHTAHAQDIERMRANANVIASALDTFNRCVRDTELPNDVATTHSVLRAQRHEHDAIKVRECVCV
jgi:hypothetical protein